MRITGGHLRTCALYAISGMTQFTGKIATRCNYCEVIQAMKGEELR